MDKQTALKNLDEKLIEYKETKSDGGKSLSYGIYLGMLLAYGQCGVISHEEFEIYRKKITDTI